MEFLRSPTPGDLPDRTGPVSVAEICLLGIRMASALHQLHANNVLHLDVKPYNVTMGDPPKLLDLSLAHTFAGPMRLRHSLGTTAYMAPEQCDHGIASAQTDLFGLGATLYEGVSATEPFPRGNEDSDERSERFPQMVTDAQPLAEFENVPTSLSHIVLA